MANFLLIRDPDTVRRQFAALQARERVGFLPRLRGELILASHYALAWAAAPAAPVEHHCAAEPDAADGVLFGAPHDGDGRACGAPDLCRRHERGWELPNELNGYYAALLMHPRLGVRAEADVLGLFPLYYWQDAEVLLIGTSPELFRCHPSFRSELDLHGAAALLLTSGLVGGRTLWRGVRRLAADHRLLCPAGPGAARELAPPVRALEPLIHSPDEAAERAGWLHESFLRAALQHCRRPGLLLSGGLDSRLLAGFAAAGGVRPECLTFGRSEDMDAHCATAVARELGLRQALLDVVPADYADYARSSVTWEQLSGGLYALPMGWNLSVRPPAMNVDGLICGLTLDAVIGGPKQVAATDTLSFARLRIGRLGFNEEELARLIGAPALARACDEVRAELVDEYRHCEASDHLREWRMNLAHRHRFAVGTCAWRYAQFAWPVMPALDRGLISLARRLPYAVVKDRQLQTRMLTTRFPRLARLELDRNYFDALPVIGAERSLLFDWRRRAAKLRRRCQVWFGRDPRFYVRTMEFNSPGWRVIRALADEARHAAMGLFRADALHRLLPPAGVTVRRLQDPIMHSTPLKNTLGLMLWLRQHA